VKKSTFRRKCRHDTGNTTSVVCVAGNSSRTTALNDHDQLFFCGDRHVVFYLCICEYMCNANCSRRRLSLLAELCIALFVPHTVG
jgi:hypothetical protein